MAAPSVLTKPLTALEAVAAAVSVVDTMLRAVVAMVEVTVVSCFHLPPPPLQNDKSLLECSLHSPLV